MYRDRELALIAELFRFYGNIGGFPSLPLLSPLSPTFYFNCCISGTRYNKAIDSEFRFNGWRGSKVLW